MKEVVESPKTLRILHCLNWYLDSICEISSIVREQGFQAVQVGPLQPLKEEGNEHWWLSYQPCALTVGNQYGSREDFIHLCNVLHDEGLMVFPDVVCTHVAGAVDGTLVPHEKVDTNLTQNPKFWRDAKLIENWDDRFQVIHYCAGLPTFDLNNEQLQDYIISFLNDLISCGADGFRFDSAKSIPTPKEGCNFLPRVLGNLNGNHLYNYGEVIFADEKLISMYTDYLDVLTNTWSEQKDDVVLFSESHDSFLGLGYTRGKSSQEITSEYAHVVDNYPKTIYYARPFDNEWMSPSVKEIHQKAKIKKYVE